MITWLKVLPARIALVVNHLTPTGLIDVKELLALVLTTIGQAAGGLACPSPVAACPAKGLSQPLLGMSVNQG